jgi:spermidine/putrescine transport system ATP-binding protein
VSFSLAGGETLCLLGSSGSGKSTLLRILAGLEIAESGRVLWDGQDLSGVPPHRRNFGLMFQDYALFPHRSVAENVGFGLRMQGRAREEIGALVMSALQQVNMAGFTGRRVTDLSGGEQQRVALARALAPRPRLLMLDEPLGALDRALREQLLDELRRLLHQTEIPAIYVTHDQEEAFVLADRVALLHGGKLVQMGTPEEVYHRPASPWVARFLGQTNLVAGTLVETQPLTVSTALGGFQVTWASRTGARPRGGQKVLVLIPMREDCDAQAGLLVRGRAIDVLYRGDGFHARVMTASEELLDFRLARPVVVGEEVEISLQTGGILAWPEGEGDE